MPIKPSHPLDQSRLYKLRSRSRLAGILGISLGELNRLSTSDALYTEFNIEKKDGGTRHVENPRRPLKVVQAKIARMLGRVAPPDFLFCPVKGRCYITNAAAHRDSRVVHCLDIKKFFPSTPKRRVFWFFETVMRCERDIAALLANLACYQGHLPTGSPLSPIIAYFSYYDLWKRMDEFCKTRGYTFTVYIDDVTVSGSKVPKRDIWEIRRMIHSVGLKYHKQKTFIDRAAEVTGVMIIRGMLVAPFRQHKKLRMAAVELQTANADQHTLRGRWAGVRGQILQIGKRGRRSPEAPPRI